MKNPNNRSPFRELLMFTSILCITFFLAGLFIGKSLNVRAGSEELHHAPTAVTPTPPVQLPETTSNPDDIWRLRLVNKTHPLPENYAPPALTQLRNGQAVDSRAYPELQRMMDDARSAGLEPLICSSYRSPEKQRELFENKKERLYNEGHPRESLHDLAAQWVAVPGTSEHETGLALDIVDLNYQLLDDAQASTPTQKWLMAHCWEYGFILRYPKDKIAETGVGYEPWHYRYVGVQAALEMQSKGLCLEEYLQER